LDFQFEAVVFVVRLVSLPPQDKIKNLVKRQLLSFSKIAVKSPTKKNMYNRIFKKF
jgi:hypothetical protein